MIRHRRPGWLYLQGREPAICNAAWKNDPVAQLTGLARTSVHAGYVQTPVTNSKALRVPARYEKQYFGSRATNVHLYHDGGVCGYSTEKYRSAKITQVWSPMCLHRVGAG